MGLLDSKNPYPNSPWVDIREGLLSEGYLRLRFGGAYILLKFYGILYIY